jgi:hypothetical protein
VPSFAASAFDSQSTTKWESDPREVFTVRLAFKVRSGILFASAFWTPGVNMRFETAVSCSYNATTGHRYTLCIKAQDGSLEFAVPYGSGAYNHIMTEFLGGADWTKWDEALLHCGALQPIRAIELDEEDIEHLHVFRVPNGPASMVSSAEVTVVLRQSE